MVQCTRNKGHFFQLCTHNTEHGGVKVSSYTVLYSGETSSLLWDSFRQLSYIKCMENIYIYIYSLKNTDNV